MPPPRCIIQDASSQLPISWRPLLARGIKAACVRTDRFLTISGHAFSYQASASSKRCIIDPRHPRIYGSVFYQTSMNFQACFQGRNNQKNCSQGGQATTKTDFDMISVTSSFLQYSLCENLELNGGSVGISNQKSVEKK